MNYFRKLIYNCNKIPKSNLRILLIEHCLTYVIIQLLHSLPHNARILPCDSPSSGPNGGGPGGTGISNPGENPIDCLPGFVKDERGDCILACQEEGYVLNEEGNCIPEDPLSEISKCEELNSSEKEQFNSVLDFYLNSEHVANCLNQQVYDYIKNSGFIACFKIGTPANTPGGYDQNGNYIYFDGLSNITEGVFGEEFFHFYQDLFYGELPYGLGRSNIEFEAKLYHDLTHFGLCCKNFDNQTQAEYLLWIESLSDGFTKMPDWQQLSGKYFYFLQKFIPEKPAYNFPIDNSLLPLALLNLNNC